MELRTQKAHGLEYMRTNGQVSRWLPPFKVAQTEAEVRDAFNAYYLFGQDVRFARPCPVTPRHGFVDSRPVRTEAEACEVFKLAKDADPEAELIMMPYINASQSAILTPTAVSVGRGHDGVTGKGKDVATFPLAHVDFSWLDKDAARVPNSPFIESVRKRDGAIYMVQLRDGPSVASVNGDTYIPKDVTVSRVVVADGDLLEWEDTMRRASSGTVVHMPGGSMLSHYAVHAVLNGHPVVFGQDAPKVGAALKANVQACKPDYRAIAQGIAHAVNAPGNTDRYDAAQACKRLMHFAVPFIHQAMALVQTREGSMAVGLAIGHLMKCGAGAALGEARHCGKHISECAGAREAYYAVALNNYARYRKELVTAHEAFEAGDYFQSYGGKRWAGISGAVLRMDTNALAFVRKPNVRTYKPLLAQVHNLLNAIHNGASWMTKFVTTGFMDSAAQGEAYAVLRAGYIGHELIRGANVAPIAPWGETLPPVSCTFFDVQVDGEYRVSFEKLNWDQGVRGIAYFGEKRKHGFYTGEMYAADFDAFKHSAGVQRVKDSDRWNRHGREEYSVQADQMCRLPQMMIYILNNARLALASGHVDRIAKGGKNHE